MEITNLKDITIPKILKKSFPISLNNCIEFLPFTISLIQFKYTNESILQEIIGLSLTYLNFSFSILIGNINIISIKCSEALGSKNINKFWSYFFFILFINFVILIFSIFSVWKCEIILNFLKIDLKLIKLLKPFLKNLIIVKVIENINNLLRGILIAQKITDIFFYVNIFNVIIFLFLSFICIIRLKLGLTGFIIAYYTKCTLEFFCLIIYLKLKSKIKFKFPKFTSVFENFWKDLKYCLFVLFGTYGEWIGIDSLSYPVTLTNKQENINSFYFLFSVSDYLYFFETGLTAYFCTYTSFILGQKKKKKFEIFSKKIFNKILIITVIVGLLIFFFSEYIAKIFTNDPKIIILTSRMIKFLFILGILDLVLEVYSSLLIMINYEDIQFYLSALVFPFLIFIFGYFFCITLELGNIGLCIGWCLGHFITVFITVGLYYMYKEKAWKDIINNDDTAFEIISLENC